MNVLAHAIQAAPQLFRTGGVVSPIRQFEAFRFDVSRGRDGLLRMADATLPDGMIDVSMLKFASQAYDISPDPRDYVIVDLPILEADYPNRNMDAFPYAELTSFNTIVGSPVWRTFRWKPTFQDHQNTDPKKAKGINFDSFMERVGNKWVVRLLSGFDRTKDEWLARQILTGKRDKYSMGAMAQAIACSCHGLIYDGDAANACDIRKQGKGFVVSTADRGPVLVHDCCFGVNFCENSSVEDPAYFRAQSDVILHGHV